ncbi:MAG TPA: PPOX class F420-dependent oxidoreductase [Acidimicrobiales bacterium]|nr:PPOX class F420-dependent oxidoreductase [Acidimicrobiales bacterium]
MELDAARAFLREHHHSVLVTTRAGGGVQTSPVVHTVGDDGRIRVSTREGAYKVRNLRRDPTASLCAFTDNFFGPWIQVDGRATIISLPEAMDLLVASYRMIAGEHEDWDEYRSAMQRDRRCIIAIDADRAGPDRSG